MPVPPKTSSIREKFGIDYLISGRDSSSVAVEPASANLNPADAHVERALTAFGHRILTMLEDAPEKSLRLYEIVDATGLNVQTLLAMTDRMAQSGLIEVLETDRYGNHKIKITSTAKEMLQS